MGRSNVKVISLGGSLIVPAERVQIPGASNESVRIAGVDSQFLQDFRGVIVGWLKGSTDRKIVFVVGGGATARVYQEAVKQTKSNISDEALDWVGIAATHLNAELIKTVFSEYVFYPVVSNPNKARFRKGRILVAGGWKPGFSTDYDAVILAKRFGAGCVINLSNVMGVYTDDPNQKYDPHLNDYPSLIERMSWAQLQKIVGDLWEPGLNLPFDPVATREAAREKLTLIVVGGKDISNLRSVLNGDKFKGTIVVPC